MNTRYHFHIILIFLILLCTACHQQGSGAKPKQPLDETQLRLRSTIVTANSYAHISSPITTPPTYGYTVKRVYPHDPGAFTQGLIFDHNTLYEGTGLRGRSSLRKVDLETGKIRQGITLPNHLFGEGITLYGDHIIQLTWQAHVGLVYNKDSFLLVDTFEYPTEGWGLTHDGKRLIMSDGTATLHFLHPTNFTEVYTRTVHADGKPVVRLNELEYIQGKIYANVWQTDRVAVIEPRTGQVLNWIDFSGLLSAAERAGQNGQPVDVLNGIAYDSEQNRLFITGKLWPKLFEVEIKNR